MSGKKEKSGNPNTQDEWNPPEIVISKGKIVIPDEKLKWKNYAPFSDAVNDLKQRQRKHPQDTIHKVVQIKCQELSRMKPDEYDNLLSQIKITKKELSQKLTKKGEKSLDGFVGWDVCQLSYHTPVQDGIDTRQKVFFGVDVITLEPKRISRIISDDKLLFLNMDEGDITLYHKDKLITDIDHNKLEEVAKKKQPFTKTEKDQIDQLEKWKKDKKIKDDITQFAPGLPEVQMNIEQQKERKEKFKEGGRLWDNPDIHQSDWYKTMRARAKIRQTEDENE